MFGWGRPRRPQVVAFDIIGTVFPLEPLRPAVVALGLPPAGLEGWFAAGLRDAFALSSAGDFHPFLHVLGGALDQVLAEQRLTPSKAACARLLDGMRHLPARPDARDAFEVMRAFAHALDHRGNPAITVLTPSDAVSAYSLADRGFCGRGLRRCVDLRVGP